MSKFTPIEPPRFLPHYNYEDYKLWEGKWELVEGIPFAMSPAPKTEHRERELGIGN